MIKRKDGMKNMLSFLFYDSRGKSLKPNCGSKKQFACYLFVFILTKSEN